MRTSLPSQSFFNPISAVSKVGHTLFKGSLLALKVAAFALLVLSGTFLALYLSRSRKEKKRTILPQGNLRSFHRRPPPDPKLAAHFSSRTAPLRSNPEFQVNFRETIRVITEVKSDGFGDLALAKSTLEAYRRRFKGNYEFVIFSDHDHQMKIQKAFSLKLTTLQSESVKVFFLENDLLPQKIDEWAAASNAVNVVVSTGYSNRKFNDLPTADFFHEMCVIPDAVQLDDAEYVYTETTLRTRFGLASSSAGIFLPQRVDRTLKEVLETTGLFDRIVGGETLEVFLKSNEISLIYIKDEFRFQEVYLHFAQKYQELTQKSIHVIAPTSSRRNLQLEKKELIKGVFFHYCGFLEDNDFDALTQLSTFPSAITGNTCPFNALAGAIPFLFDPRIILVSVIEDLRAFCLEHQDEVGQKCMDYFNYMNVMTSTECRREPKAAEKTSEKILSLFVNHKEELRRGLAVFYDLMQRHRNAEHVLCNRMIERVTVM